MPDQDVSEILDSISGPRGAIISHFVYNLKALTIEELIAAIEQGKFTNLLNERCMQLLQIAMPGVNFYNDMDVIEHKMKEATAELSHWGKVASRLRSEFHRIKRRMPSVYVSPAPKAAKIKAQKLPYEERRRLRQDRDRQNRKNRRDYEKVHGYPPVVHAVMQAMEAGNSNVYDIIQWIIDQETDPLRRRGMVGGIIQTLRRMHECHAIIIHYPTPDVEMLNAGSYYNAGHSYKNYLKKLTVTDGHLPYPQPQRR